MSYTCLRTLELRGWVYPLFRSSLVICGEGVNPSAAVLRDDDRLPAPAGPEGGQPEAALEDKLPEIVSTGLGLVKDKVTKTLCVFFL